MKKIDVSEWKEFRVGDLFSCNTTLSIPSKNDLTDGDVNYITRSSVDNGFSGTCGDYDYINAGQCITIGAEGFVAFWQADDFVAGNKVYALRHDALNEANALFVCAALNALSYKYSFANARVLNAIKDEIIKLPATEDGEPDWDYMESHMRSVMDREAVFAGHLASLTAEAVADGTVVDTSAWKEFKIGDLFEVVKGTRLTKAHMVHGETRFIGSSAMNNGCTAMVGNTDNMHLSNAITVCYNGSVGETFYQDEPFLASDDVNVLYPKFNMNVEIALFIVPLIKAVSVRYNYVDKWKQEVMVRDKIKLPATPDGNPDWCYMERYMQSVMRTESVFADELDSLLIAG